MKNWFSNYLSDTSPQGRNAFRIALAVIVGLFIVAPYFIYLVIQINTWQLYAALTYSIVFALIVAYSAVLARRNQVDLAVLLIYISTSFGLTFLTALISDLGLLFSPALFLFVLVLAGQTLSGSTANRALATGTIFAALILLTELFAPWTRLSNPTLYSLAFMITIMVVIILGFLVVRLFTSYPLRIKFVVVFIAITLVPLVSLGAYANNSLQNALNQNTRESLSQLANQMALQVDSFIENQLNSIDNEAQDPVFTRFLSLAPDQRMGSREEVDAQNALEALGHQGEGYINSYALVDKSGIVILHTGNSQVKDDSQADYFKKPLENNQPVVIGPIFDQKNSNAFLYFSAPVKSFTGNDHVGVLYVQYNANVVQFIVGKLVPPGNPNGLLLRIVSKDNYIRIANTGNLGLLYTSYKDFKPEEVIALQKQGLLLPGAFLDAVISENDTIDGLNNLDRTPFFVTGAKSPGTRTVNTATTLKSVPWFAFVRQPEITALRPLQDQTRTITLVALLLLGLVTLVAFGVSQLLAQPVLRLATIARNITAGDLNSRAEITTQDEIGTLAEAFNRMSSQLRETLTGLEQRVSDRTVDLKNAVLISEKRAQELQSISEISRLISSEQRIDILLPFITRLVSERFNYYHIGIFFIDSTRQFAVLQASNSEGGQKMLGRGHRLEVGQTGIVGNVAQTGKPLISLDVGLDAVYFDNPDLPNTRSEMALPLNFRGKTIGVLDVQSTKPGAFTDRDANTLSILADQIAIAIENARLFEQAQQALDEVQSLYTQYQQNEWKSFNRQESKIAYQQSLTGGKPLNSLVESDEIRNTVQKGAITLVKGDSVIPPSLVIPIQLHGLTIGVLSIKAPTKNRKWNQDEINLAQAVSERLGLALDNARLLQDLQRRAAKEAKIGEVTAKIGSSINMRNVMQIAVEELGHALPGSEVIIRLQPTDGKAG